MGIKTVFAEGFDPENTTRGAFDLVGEAGPGHITSHLGCHEPFFQEKVQVFEAYRVRIRLEPARGGHR